MLVVKISITINFYTFTGAAKSTIPYSLSWWRRRREDANYLYKPHETHPIYSRVGEKGRAYMRKHVRLYDNAMRFGVRFYCGPTPRGSVM